MPDPLPINLVRGGLLIDNQSMGATFTSTKIVDLTYGSNLSLQFYSASGTRAGTWTAEISNNGDNWVAYPGISVPVSASAVQSDIVDASGINARYLRLVFTRSAGDGTANVWVSLKRKG